MFDFTTIGAAVVDFIASAMTLIDPTTLIGGVVTVSIVGAVMVSLVKRVRSLAR